MTTADAPPPDPGGAPIGQPPLDPEALAALANQMYAESAGVYPESAAPVPDATPGAGAAQDAAMGASPEAAPAAGQAAETVGALGAAPAPTSAPGPESPPAAGPGALDASSYYFMAQSTNPDPSGSADPSSLQQEHPRMAAMLQMLDPSAFMSVLEPLQLGLGPMMPGAEAATAVSAPPRPPGIDDVPMGAMPEAGAPAAEADPRAQAPAQPKLPFMPEMPAEAATPLPADGFDVETVRKDFPILHQKINGMPLIWLDNAATTQKPQAVIDAMSRFYQRDYSNIHRGAHTLAARATDAYENARKKVAGFLGAGSSEEIVFVRGTTEAINLVANTWGKKFLQPGDEIVLTTLEHHANIVPWQFIAKETGAVIRVVPVTDRGEVIQEEYERLLGPRTRIAAFTHVSNALGTVNPVKDMAAMAHRYGAKVLVDGAQSVPHQRVNVQDLDADFFVFSSHKLFGPSGVGVLYAKKELLELMPPWQGGGAMIRDVTFEHSTFESPPTKFEAGTPTITDAVGLGAAIDYLERLGMDNIARHECVLLDYAMKRMGEIPGLKPIGTAPGKVSVLSFLLDGATPEEVGRYLDTQGIAVRAGHHCAQPTMHRFGTHGTVRPSLAFYNTHDEVDALIDALRRYPRH